MSYIPALDHALTKDITVELGVVVSKRGRDISESDVESYIAGYGMFLSDPTVTEYTLIDVDAAFQRWPWI